MQVCSLNSSVFRIDYKCIIFLYRTNIEEKLLIINIIIDLGANDLQLWYVDSEYIKVKENLVEYGKNYVEKMGKVISE